MNNLPYNSLHPGSKLRPLLRYHQIWVDFCLKIHMNLYTWLSKILENQFQKYFKSSVQLKKLRNNFKQPTQ